MSSDREIPDHIENRQSSAFPTGNQLKRSLCGGLRKKNRRKEGKLLRNLQACSVFQLVITKFSSNLAELTLRKIGLKLRIFFN